MPILLIILYTEVTENSFNILTYALQIDIGNIFSVTSENVLVLETLTAWHYVDFSKEIT